MNVLKDRRLKSVFEILSTKGHEQYGQEAVSQLEHALQCATLAETNNSSPELIITRFWSSNS